MQPRQSRDQRAKQANDWLTFIQSKYATDINTAIANTFTAINTELPTSRYPSTNTSIYKNDSITCLIAAHRHDSSSHYCLLNFASYYNPGGGFLKGSMAQEEALCHRSLLYPVLKSFDKTWYTAHRQNKSDTYGDDFLYTSDLFFFNGQQIVKSDVLTMAAVNFNNISNYSKGLDTMIHRTEIAYTMPAKFGADTLILGAWGCGVFKNDPKFVVEQWKTLTKKYDGLYKTIIHPLLDPIIYKTFRQVYN